MIEYDKFIVSVDVYYYTDNAVASCVIFKNWSDSIPYLEYTACISNIEPYESGKFYLRELPCILKVLQKVTVPISTIIIDGYVWLETNKPGLGYYLYKTLDEKIAIIGVAKNKFKSAAAVSIYRGKSKNPLFITSIGIDINTAAKNINSMNGPFRIPKLLKYTDELSRKK